MKKLKSISLPLVLIVLVAFGCKKESSSIQTNNHLGEAFSVKMHETVNLSPYKSENFSTDSTLVLKFDTVLVEGRCALPIAELCYGGSAWIRVQLTTDNKTFPFELRIPSSVTELSCDSNLYYRKDTLGYRFCFVKLDPYPNIEPIDPKTYIAKIIISKP